jgi:hypothetical protein
MSVVGESVHIPGPLAKLRVAARAEPSLASVGDYLALMKPRVMSLVGLVLVEQGIGLPSHALFR